jgi:hypothetical protein
MTTPVRRKTDPVPGTRARTTPVTNDAFTQKMPKGTPAPKQPEPYKAGTGGAQRKAVYDEIIKKAEGMKRGGLVKKRKC